MTSAFTQAKELAEYNNKLEQSNVQQQYNYNKLLAEQDRSWQERMANSAHQREIRDLKEAGLNPVLSITGGNGAVTPSGSSASVSKANTDMSLPGKVMDMAIAQLNSATSLQQTMMQNANTLAIAQLNASTSKYVANTQAVASMYGSNMSYKGTQYSSNMSYQGTKYASDTSSATDIYKHNNTGSNTLLGQISNAPNLLQKFLGNTNSAIRNLFPNAKEAQDNVFNLYSTYAKYIKTYDKQVKNGWKPSSSERSSYNYYKSLLKRVGFKY